MLPAQKTPPKMNLSDLTVLLYGVRKIGKSTFCSQAEGALFLATEAGLHGLEVYQQPISTWEEFLAACKEIAEGNHSFKTVVVDTIDNAYRMCAEHVCERRKIEHESDLDYGKGFALVNNEFFRVLNKLSLLPYGLFLISHSQDKEVETRTGKITKTVPTLPEKARQIVLGMADMILFCDLESDGKALRRVVRTQPHTHYEAGERFHRLPETIDLSFQKLVEAFVGGRTTTAEQPATPPAKPPAASVKKVSAEPPKAAGDPKAAVAR